MKYDLKGLEIFTAGMIVSIVTNFLAVLDMGKAISLGISAAEVAVFIVMLAGIESLIEYSSRFMMARNLLIAEILCSLAVAVLMGMSYFTFSDWVTDTAMLLVLLRAALYIGIMICALYGCAMIAKDPKYEKKIILISRVYLAAALAEILINILSVFLINEFPALWLLLVFISGIAVMAAGVWIVTAVNRIFGICGQRTSL